jgi:hypothetical protein
VARVRIQDQLCCGNTLCQDVRVDRRRHHVVSAVDHERGLLDQLELCIGFPVPFAPTLDGRRAGIEEPDVDGAAEPYALELSGQWRQAAEFWEKRGCPYEAALALASASDDDALRRSLAELQRLGGAVRLASSPVGCASLARGACRADHARVRVRT